MKIIVSPKSALRAAVLFLAIGAISLVLFAIALASFFRTGTANYAIPIPMAILAVISLVFGWRCMQLHNLRKAQEASGVPYRYRLVDAFVAEGSSGNPAACFFLDEGQCLTEAEMQAVAKEHKGIASEVAYCTTKDGTIHLAYFSPESEVDFCGHATIACMHSLIKDSPELLAKREITVQTNRKGALTVYNELESHDSVLISAPKPVWIGTHLDNHSIAESLGIPDDVIDGTHPMDLIDAGLRTLIVPLSTLAAVLSVSPQEQTLREFCIANGIDIVVVFSNETESLQRIAHTRVFAPRFGYLEDPATGSGNSALGYYMLQNRLWDGSPCIIEQGPGGQAFNAVRLSLLDGRVLFGGNVAVRVDGFYYTEIA